MRGIRCVKSDGDEGISSGMDLAANEIESLSSGSVVIAGGRTLSEPDARPARSWSFGIARRTAVSENRAIFTEGLAVLRAIRLARLDEPTDVNRRAMK